MKLIGLTGPSGTGKSSITQLALNLGYFVIDCDKTAARVTEFPQLLKELEKAFGGVVKNGKLDRAALADKAFSSKEQTEKLNSIMLPVIINEIKREINIAKKAGHKVCLLDAPTLYESGLDTECEAVIAVLAKRSLRATRINQRDGLTGESLERRLNAAKPEEFYIKRTGHIIYNNGSMEEYLNSADVVLKKFI